VLWSDVQLVIGSLILVIDSSEGQSICFKLENRSSREGDREMEIVGRACLLSVKSSSLKKGN